MIGVAGALDSLRAGVLRLTLRSSFARQIFRQRELRTPFWFLCSLGVQAALVAWAPGFLFYWVPLLLGVPHVVAGFRYGWGRSSGWGVYLLVTFLFGGVLAAGASPAWATLIVGITLFGMQWKGVKIHLLSAVLVLGVLGLGFFKDAYRTSLVLVILHNFVAFIFWFRAFRTKNERMSGGVLLLITIGVAIALAFWSGGASVGELAHRLAGLEGDRFGTAFVRIFLLTQGIHYFIWLKAIPDQEAPARVPMSFRSAFREDHRWFGKQIHVFVMGAVLSLVALAVYRDVETARRWYVFLSAYHGFAEFAFLLGPGPGRGNT